MHFLEYLDDCGLLSKTLDTHDYERTISDFEKQNTRHPEPDISAMVKASIIVNWEDWLTKKGYSDDFVELDKILTEYLTIPIHSDPPEFNPDLNTALNEGWNRCDQMWRDRIQERINILEFDIQEMKPLLNTMGNIEVSKMISTASFRMNTLKSLLSDTEPKSPEPKQSTDSCDCVRLLGSTEREDGKYYCDICGKEQYPVGSISQSPEVHNLSTEPTVNIQGQSPDADGWVKSELLKPKP